MAVMVLIPSRPGRSDCPSYFLAISRDICVPVWRHCQTACRFPEIRKPVLVRDPLMIAFMPARGKRFQPAAAAFPS
jgi:hypothetical protein